MKKSFKKFGVIVLALAMVFALTIPAMAAEGEVDFTDTHGVVGAFTADNPTVQGRVVKLQKELTVYNADEATVNAPVMTYSYTITGLSESKALKDDGTMHNPQGPVAVLTKDASGLAPTITGVSLTNDIPLNASEAGTANKFPITIDFTSVTFPAAGVYRFQISETTTVDTKNAAGITDGGIAEILYLDVYVKGNNEIYGYVCFKNNNNIDGTDGTSVAGAEKTEGFTTGDTDGNGTVEADEMADKYYTFNVTVSKTLTGDDGMKDNQFPFSVDFTNASVTASIKTIVKPEGTATGSAKTGAVSALDDTPTIADGGSVKYIGIPVGVTAPTTVAVYETNNVTGTVYKSSFKVDNGTASTAKSISWEDTKNQSDTAELTVTANAADATAHTIAFTNVLEVISPTGVVIRVAPFAAMAGAGVLFLAISKKSKKEEEDA